MRSKLIGTIVVVALMMPAALAQNKAAPAAGAMGSVDIQRVSGEYKGFQQSLADFRGQAQTLDKVLQRLAQSSARLLSDAEIREVAGLYERTLADRPSATEAQKQRVQALEAKATAAGQELTTLQSTASPSDAQKKRLADLTSAQEKSEATLQSVQQEFRQRLSGGEQELNKKLAAEVKTAINAVAKEKNLGVVFDAQLAIYAQIDITDDVIKRLNK